MSKAAAILERRLAALEAAIAAIGHNGGPPLDDDEQQQPQLPSPPKRKPFLLADRLVAERYDVTVRTLERWDGKPDLGFPPPVYIRRRRFRVIEKLDEWDRANARKMVDAHNPRRALAQALPRAQRGRFSNPRNVEAP
jgi:hypothetical protein